jgi:protein SCO1/2/putative membrane protein
MRSPQRPSSEQEPLPVGDFALTERSGRSVRSAELRGKVWVASFVFTRCLGGCPQVTETMQRLQKDFARYSDVRLVTFTVDPERDHPEELRRYADRYEADPNRWLFLTGTDADITRLLDQFHLYAKKDATKKEGLDIEHSMRLALVDRDGNILDYYDGLVMQAKDEPYDDAKKRFEDGIRKLKAQVAELESSPIPALNASLNALAGALILLGYSAVRQRLLRLHAILMLSALAVSAVFLASYLYFHIVVREGRATRFSDQAPDASAWVAYLYHTILWSHIVLAVPATALALFTAYQGLRGRLDRHVRVARWTLPIWLYVSVTGVVVYWMLYRLYAPG